VYTELKGLINHLTENIKITDKERNCLIGTTNIAIYSNSYWSFQNNNPDTPWGNTKALPGWVERDVVAFIAGCYTCLILGPEACAACGIINAVISSFLE
ncbi:MAG: hypothetical protein J7L46_04985, partial [Bacteroidales bacterium]|nr:hypothetical protein [Bacteroidales bacterium]